MAARPRVFTIPSTAPFLPTLATALMDGSLVPGFAPGRDPLALATATIYLPTRRACRLARTAFLQASGGEAVLLPRLRALGDIDEDELAFADVLAGPLASEALGLSPAIALPERRLLLAQLIQRWSASPEMIGDGHAPLVATTPEAALRLADALARLNDDMITRGVPWERLDQLVPEQHEPYWQLTLKFLKIARDTWPAVLAERGEIEPAERRDRLLEAEAARLVSNAEGPVIAAGSTGSMPATADLLATIARLPHGALVLPGVDIELDDTAWDVISAERAPDNPAVSHPQFALHTLLRGLQMHRDEVVTLGEQAAAARVRLLSEAMRPASATDAWRGIADRHDRAAAMEGLAVIEAAGPEEEALCIAISLREALETDGKTAALVTPDRTLARRVAAALRRWNIVAEDTAGESLADAPAGIFARLVIEAGLEGLEPVTLLA
ncbi:MAG: ATP-dependent helicase/nuclease subunit, partial [Variibacter sp.]|nr:ATP-dependent helicase/nuclease subunit [Variibacter sp.]